MNRLTAVLVATTLVAAAAAIHYARAWLQVRSGDADPLPAVAAAVPRPAAPYEATDVAEVTIATPAGAPDPQLPDEEAAIRVLGVGRDPVSLAVARHRLAALLDPQQRAQRAKEVVDLLLAGGWETVAPQIGMSEHELARFLEARAQAMLQRNVRVLECQLAAACDGRELRAAQNGAGRRDEEELLGPDRFARLRAFQQAGQEHQFARQLGRRLPAGMTLSDADISRLALALAEERRRFSEQAEQGGLRGISQLTSSFLLLRAATAPGAADEYARLRESAGDYGRRLASRAAAVLTPAQFQQFSAVLDAELATFQYRLRNQEAEAALRRQALEAVAP